MLFNSFYFLGAFAVFVPVYYLLPRWRLWVLTAASLGFYASFTPSHLPVLIGLSAATHLCGLQMGAGHRDSRRRLALATGVLANLGALALFKYAGFVATSIADVMPGLSQSADPLVGAIGATPAGLSFYAFSGVSYLADVYARRLDAERNPARLFAYIAFFPKLLAGPIERGRAFLVQLDAALAFDGARVAAGLEQLLWGLTKKVVIADRLAVFVDRAYGQIAFASPADLLIATYFFAFQLYCDFSGYSDMAIGVARVLGFDLGENFRRPYFSSSVREFWSARWHVSLSAWFRDYVYVPLGGSRVSLARTCLNLLTVFVLSGLWHGANWTFVVWGGLNGLYVVIGTVRAKWRGATGRTPDAAMRPAVSWLRSLGGAVVTFHLVLVSWVFFRAPTASAGLDVLSRVARAWSSLPGQVAQRMTPELWISVALILALLAAEWLDERRSIWARLSARPAVLRWAFYYLLMAALLVAGHWDLRQFVYMQF